MASDGNTGSSPQVDPVPTNSAKATPAEAGQATVERVLFLEQECDRLRQSVKQLTEECDHLQQALGEAQAERDSFRAAAYAWAREQFPINEREEMPRLEDGVPLSQLIAELEQQKT